MSSRHRAATLGLALLMTTAWPAAARAQIYYWRDASGSFVLSDKPSDPAARTYAVQRNEGIRTTMPINHKRAAKYDTIIREQADMHGVDANLVRAVIQAESAYDPEAVSVKGAMGLMQLMPATAREFGARNPFDPVQNITAGVAYLKSLLVKYRENLDLTLAAYNAGPTAVRKYGDTVPPYKETKNYVRKITGAVQAAPPPVTRVYKTVEIVDGRPVTKFSSKPSAGAEAVRVIR